MTKLKATLAVISDEPNLNGYVMKYQDPTNAFTELVGKDLDINFQCTSVEQEDNYIVGYFDASADYLKMVLGQYPFIGHKAESVQKDVFLYTEGTAEFIEPYFVNTHSDIGANPLEVVT